MTSRWERTGKPEKLGVGFISLAIFLIWIGAMIEAGGNIGADFLFSGMILLMGTGIFSVAYIVDWEK